MVRTLPRRQFLSSLIALPAFAAALTACSEGDSEAVAQESGGAANAPEPKGSASVSELMAEGPLPDKVLGEEDAPVTIIEYASMTCPHCAHFHETTFPELKEQYVDTGKVRFILREFPFDPRAEAGFMLARCADDRYFPMIDVLFARQNNWATVENARDALLQISRLAGFSQESFEACLTDQSLLDDIRAVRTRGAEEFGVDSTPTFFINGNRYTGAMSIEEMSAIIDGML